MPQARYQIFQLSARAVMSYATETENGCSFDLSASVTEKCKSRTAAHEQDSNALFFRPCASCTATATSNPMTGR